MIRPWENIPTTCVVAAAAAAAPHLLHCEYGVTLD